jgi:hypothetical protein
MARSTSKQPPTKNFTDLEAHLAGTLTPVAPPSLVTQRLRSRIHMPDRHLIAERIASWRSFIVALGGTMSVLVLVISVVRALVHLVTRKT